MSEAGLPPGASAGRDPTSERQSWSVVVASFRDLDLLAQCLDSIRPQCTRLGATLLVARAAPEAERLPSAITSGCRVVRAHDGATIPEIRGIGLTHARGEWVAVTEDHCVADAGWLEAFRAASDPEVRILGGSMGNARRKRPTDCGAFFAEYGSYGTARDRSRGRHPPPVTGANVAYHRSVVDAVAEWALGGCWEGVIHDRLYAAGHRFRLVPAARIRQNHRYGLGAFCRDRFEHGRAHAATRRRHLTSLQKAIYCAGSPLLPAILGWRILRAVSPEERPYLLKGLPSLVAFLLAWSVGEAVGYARGMPNEP